MLGSPPHAPASCTGVPKVMLAACARAPDVTAASPTRVRATMAALNRRRWKPRAVIEPLPEWPDRINLLLTRSAANPCITEVEARRACDRGRLPALDPGCCRSEDVRVHADDEYQ